MRVMEKTNAAQDVVMKKAANVSWHGDDTSLTARQPCLHPSLVEMGLQTCGAVKAERSLEPRNERLASGLGSFTQRGDDDASFSGTTGS